MMSPELTFLLDKARKFCTYQERCIFDVKRKLLEWKASDKTIEEIIHQLEDEDFINEERFAVSFAIGKLRNNKWGRNKIFYALMQKHIPELYVQMGLSEIDEEEYLEVLKTVIASKSIDEPDEYRRQNKLVKYARKSIRKESTKASGIKLRT
jgi:regulatory protein